MGENIKSLLREAEAPAESSEKKDKTKKAKDCQKVRRVASYTLDGKTQEDIRMLAYYERKTQKEIIEEAISKYLGNYDLAEQEKMEEIYKKNKENQ